MKKEAIIIPPLGVSRLISGGRASLPRCIICFSRRNVKSTHIALSEYQCIRYALDKPGVLAVLPGIKSMDELSKLLNYHDQPEEAYDYSILGTLEPAKSRGRCVYCNHCMPCPAGLDIGLINKYYDLSKVGDTLAREHYMTLENTASDCAECGHCDSRCPFGVHQSERMKEIAEYFGK